MGKQITWVYGNDVSLAIPLQKDIITQNGRTREDYVPGEGAQITVTLVGPIRKYDITPVMDGNIATVAIGADVARGTYAVETVVVESDGSRRRSKWDNIINIVDANDGVVDKWDEFADFNGVLLSASIFYFAKGDKGDTGERGPQGYTFTPDVDENGVISWTNDGDLENPESRDLVGIVEEHAMMRHDDDWWNMNTCLEDGFYSGCHQGRPADSSEGEFYSLLVTTAKRADENDGVDIITQVCFSSSNAQRIFTRKIITTDRTVYESPTTTYEDWKLINADALALKQDVIADLETIRAGAALGATSIQEHQSLADYSTTEQMNTAIETAVSTKQDVINDLDAIRAGAALGATSIQEHQSLADYSTTAQMETAIENAVSGKQDTISDLDEIRAGAALGATSIQEHQSLAAYSTTTQMESAIEAAVSTKQDTISDLQTIREGAALGATAIQEHQSLADYSTTAQMNSAISTAVAGKQDVISDLQDIREGAALGATALQEHQSLAAYSTTEQMNTAIGNAVENKVDKETGKGLSTNDYTTDEKTKLAELPSNSEVSETEEVIAQAFAQQQANIDGINAALKNLGETKAVCIDFEILPMVCGVPLVIQGSGAPSVVPMFIGERYHDKTNRKIYEAMQVTNSTNDWVALN